MWKWNLDLAAPRVGALVVAAVALATPALADVYAWRTDDGVFAYTDDPKKIPTRYAEQAVRVRETQLDGYSRYTREDSDATRAVADRLERRLEYLRRLNGGEGSLPVVGARDAGARSTTVTVATGDERAPTMDVTVEDDSEPVVVEPFFTKQSGRAVTRRSTVVRQGDRTLAIIRGRSRHTDPNRDIYDEDDLLDGE